MYYRNCPKCGKELSYKNNGSFKKAILKNTNCAECAKPKDFKHSNETLRIISEKCKGYKHSQEALIKISNASKGKNNPMYGKSVYDCWIKKYGKEIADKKLKELSIKRSKNASGENNPMYGRPSPEGSGNGWSGWYKNIYFRSILELSYLKYLLDNNIKFEIAEKRKFAVQYFDNISGNKKNYFADFYLIDSQELIEVKPKKILETSKNKEKFKAARDIYKDKFIILTEDDILKVTKDEIKKMYESKDLIWIERYEIKYKNLLNEVTK